MSRKKGLNKNKVGFSIDKELSDKLEKYCEENLINKSKLINKLIKDFLFQDIKNKNSQNVKTNCLDNENG